MGGGLNISGASLNELRLYYVFVFLSFVYLLIKFKKRKFSLLVVLLFYNGLFTFISKDFQNIYKIALLLISFYFLTTSKFTITKRKTLFVILSFMVFSGSYFYSSFINNDYVFITFSQYSRYFVLFSLFLILFENQNNEYLKKQIEDVLYKVLLVQIGLSIVKFIIIGPIESIVGSVASQGGGLATPIPIMAFMFLWLKKAGRFQLKDWWIILGFAFIGFVSLKRAIWFVMPVILALFMFYIPKRKIPNRSLLLSLLVVPVLFYLGVRFNKSLNKEGIVGGSFDFKYAYDYARSYMFGAEGSEKSGTGRGGATVLLFDKFSGGNLTSTDWYGYGLRFMYATDYAEFQELGFGISTKGAATGFFQSYITGGYLGIFALLIFSISLLIKTKNRRLMYVLIGFFWWDYFFYAGIILREYSVSFLFLYLILFSGKKLEREKIYVYPELKAPDLQCIKKPV